MGKGIIQSLASSGGGGGSCCCWSEALCYETAAPGSPLLVYRENNNFGSHVGDYLSYTWSPDAPYSLPNFPALVHGPQVDTQRGNACFSPDYKLMYSMWCSQGSSPTTQFFQVTDVSNPYSPVVVLGPVPIGNFSGFYNCLSLSVDPTTGLLWLACLNLAGGAGPYTSYGNIDPATGNFTYVGNITTTQLDIFWAFDLAGNGYLFYKSAPNTGKCQQFPIGGPGGAVLWTYGTNKYVTAFMGYAGGGHYGVSTYDPDSNTYTNEIITITTGAVSDTIVGEKRGLFYLVGQPLPPLIVPFIRVFSNCDGTITYTDHAQITGELITIPEGAIVEICP